MAEQTNGPACGLVYSGIGGQAVLEGVMMRSGADYAVALRRGDGRITVHKQRYEGLLAGSPLRKIPLVRGVIVFIDSLVLGMRCTNESSDAYMEEEEGAEGSSSGDSGWMTAAVVVLAFALAIGLFMLLPYFLSALIGRLIGNRLLTVILEGVLRVLIFIAYVAGISLMEDIRRLYRFHGAEHKCINCIESGLPLTVENARASTRFHKRCGSSFLMFVVLVSIVVCFFIRTGQPLLRVVLRIALFPVIAGISYEFIRLAGTYQNPVLNAISAPGLWLQRITTGEPDDEMLRVGIASVEAVFDWKTWLCENYGFRREDLPDNGVTFELTEDEDAVQGSL